MSVDKKTVIKSVNKLIADKEAVRSYMKGEVPLKKLTEKGIKFAKPL